MSSWRDKLKESAKEALHAASDKRLEPARLLLKEIEKAGKACRLNATGDGLVVTPGPVPEELAARIRTAKPELVELLRGAPQVWRWKPEDVSIQVSLMKSAISDFVLAPPVEGVGHVPMKPELQRVLLEGASEDWRRKVKSLGGLVIYSPSQWDAAKPKLEAAL